MSEDITNVTLTKIGNHVRQIMRGNDDDAIRMLAHALILIMSGESEASTSYKLDELPEPIDDGARVLLVKAGNRVKRVMYGSFVDIMSMLIRAMAMVIVSEVVDCHHVDVVKQAMDEVIKAIADYKEERDEVQD